MTTITYRDNILAADQCLTWYETDSGKEPTSRSSIKKIRLYSIDPYRRLAIATRGDSIDGTLIERLVIRRIKDAVADEMDGQDRLGEEEWNDWGVNVKGVEWNAPDDEQNGILMYRDLRFEARTHVWELSDPRIIQRVEPGKFVAVGCDAPLAYAAMEAGADAIKAVWIAGKYGTATAGPVNYVNCSTMLLNTQRRNPLEL